MVLVWRLRGRLRRYGPTQRIRYERKYKEALTCNAQTMNRAIQVRARDLFKNFIVKSADKFEKLEIF